MHFEDILSKIEELPTPDPIVQKIISVASDPNASAKELSEVIKLDASLTVRILRLVNSAYYGLPRKIVALNEAIMILGFKTVRNIALSVFTYSSVLKGNKKSSINHMQLWKHFLGVAVGCELLAQMTGYPNKEELFIAGLLHDIGKVALDYISPDAFSAVAKLTENLGISFSQAEEKLNLPNHAMISGKMIEQWNLPEIVVQSAAGHHVPNNFADSVYSDVVAMVHISDFFINLMKHGNSYTYGGLKLSSFALNILGIKPRFLTNYADKMKDKLKVAEEFMKIEQEVS
ncbi:HDOD domain-containing protein [Pseudothermotoga sp.]|uniref:HDOD domain-containing protein n=1 Tax=Pseudothermotoga sp. TaxID=2033661 RepID=UPI000E9F42E4|nr:HDOD domain-containing protein [Pseudothermotoga sp.]HBJ82244.1 phosphohydrolase [Pseudothermotoga sp.]